MSLRRCQILIFNPITNVYVRRSCSNSEVSVRSQSAPVWLKGLRSSLKFYFVWMESSRGLHLHLRNLHKTHQTTVWLLVQHASVKEPSQFSWKDSLEMKPGTITWQLNASLGIKTHQSRRLMAKLDLFSKLLSRSRSHHSVKSRRVFLF